MRVSNKYTNEQVLQAAIAEKCRRSFFFFVKQFWDVIIPETPVWNWHIEYLCNELQEIGIRVKNRLPTLYDYYIINVPPGSSKSTIVSEMYVAWCWTIDPTQRFICGSYAATPAEDIADKCKKIIVSDKYVKLFGYFLYSDAKTNLKTKQNGQRITTTVGGSITGIHAHQIVLDDPLNAQQATSEAERATANKWATETISTRKVSKELTPTIVVMQRLHEEDTTGYLLGKDLRIKHICLPAELPEQALNNVLPIELRERYVDGLLDPVRLNRDVLKSQRATLGSYGYSGQFDQRPADLANGIIKWNWFDIVDMLPRGTQKFVLDTAYTVKLNNDPTGLLSYFVEDNTLYITNWESQRLEFPELVKYTQTFAIRNGYTKESILRIEPKASGKSLVQQIIRETDFNIAEAEPPDKDKVTRATSITSILEARRVKLLRGAWNNDFLTEICTFPKAAHDEAVDCLYMAVSNELQGSGWEDFLIVNL